MLLNPKQNSFFFQFPKGFFPEIIVEKYLPYLKKQPVPFDSLSQYVNSTIQTIGFPGLQLDSVEQVRPLGKKVTYKGSTPIQDLFSKDLNIQFRLVDGFINYFIMLDTILWYVNFAQEQVFIQNLPLRIMDSEGNVVVSANFQQAIISSFSELQFAYTSNAAQDANFSMGFKFNYLDVKLEAK
jgi:hypothetical protein